MGDLFGRKIEYIAGIDGILMFRQKANYEGESPGD